MKLVRMFAFAALLAVLAPAGAQAQGRGGRGGFGGPGQLLQIPEVQKELKLDEAQIDLLKQLSAEMREKGQALFQGAQNLSEDERNKRFRDFRAESDKKVGEILDAKQKTRLRQLEIQQMGARAVSRPDVQDELKLTADQKQKIQAAVEGEGAAMRAAFEGFQGGQNMTDQQRQDAFAKMREVRTQTDAKITAVLTEAQKKQLVTMQGAPFKFPEMRGGFGRRQNNN